MKKTPPFNKRQEDSTTQTDHKPKIKGIKIKTWKYHFAAGSAPDRAQLWWLTLLLSWFGVQLGQVWQLTWEKPPRSCTWWSSEMDQWRAQASPCGKGHFRAGLAVFLEQGMEPWLHPHPVTTTHTTGHLSLIRRILTPRFLKYCPPQHSCVVPMMQLTS